MSDKKPVNAMYGTKMSLNLDILIKLKINLMMKWLKRLLLLNKLKSQL